MPLPNSPLAYVDCREVMDQALADEKGIRVKYDSHDEAFRMRSRCHQARVIDRNENALSYEKGEPMHGKSMYDELFLRILTDDDQVYLYFEKRLTPTADTIESLSEVEPPKKQITEQKKIAHVKELVDDFTGQPLTTNLRRI